MVEGRGASDSGTFVHFFWGGDWACGVTNRKLPVNHVGQSILPGEQAVVSGYHVWQAVLPGGTGGQA